MSNCGLGRRQALQYADDVETRLEIPVDAHVGSPRDYQYRLQQAASIACKSTEKRDQFFAKVFPWAVDARNLFLSWMNGKAGDGHAPGSDGMTYSDIPRSLLWDFLREQERKLLVGEYQPAPILEKQIPKGPGRGTRTLDLPTITDRMVGRAVLQAVQPFVEARLDRNILGGRTGRSRYHALARAELLASTGDRWVWIAQDLRSAFPSLPRARLRDVLLALLPNEKLVELMMKLLDNGNRRGIPQGQPLSPMVFNSAINHYLVRPWHRQHPDLPILTWLDDLLVLCHDGNEAAEAHNDLDRLLRPTGLQLKHPVAKSIVDLGAGQTAEWLGFSIQKGQDGIQVKLTADMWADLEDHLQLAHLKPNPPLRAIETVEGWIDQLGPVLPWEDSHKTISCIQSLARTYSFEELPHERDLLERWEQAHIRWEQVREAVQKEHGEVQRDGSAERHRVFSIGRSRGEPVGSPPPAPPEYELSVAGACTDNRIGGWAYILDRIGRGVGSRSQSYGACSGTTKNRMELLAVIEGLEALRSPASVRISTSCVYIRLGIADWLPRWRAQGWQKGAGESHRSPANVDLWRRLDAQLQRHRVSVRWVAACSGHPEIEQCNRLAGESAEQLYDPMKSRNADRGSDRQVVDTYKTTAAAECSGDDSRFTDAGEHRPG